MTTFLYVTVAIVIKKMKIVVKTNVIKELCMYSYVHTYIHLRLLSVV